MTASRPWVTNVSSPIQDAYSLAPLAPKHRTCRPEHQRICGLAASSSCNSSKYRETSHLDKPCEASLSAKRSPTYSPNKRSPHGHIGGGQGQGAGPPILRSPRFLAERHAARVSCTTGSTRKLLILLHKRDAHWSIIEPSVPLGCKLVHLRLPFRPSDAAFRPVALPRGILVAPVNALHRQ